MDAGFLADLFHHGGVAAQFDRAGIDEAAHAVDFAELDQTFDGFGDEGRAVEGGERVELHAAEGDEQVFVHQGAAEGCDRDGAGDGVDHGWHLCVPSGCGDFCEHR